MPLLELEGKEQKRKVENYWGQKERFHVENFARLGYVWHLGITVRFES